jgi:ketosteroid isomerase-like protein
MITSQQAREFADHWIAAWNAHDLDAILSHYASSVTLTSPVVANLLNDPSGTVSGKEALRSYFQRALEAFPSLKFTLHDVLCGLSSVVLYYTNHKGTKTAEFMEFSADKKVIRVIANYSA